MSFEFEQENCIEFLPFYGLLGQDSNSGFGKQNRVFILRFRAVPIHPYARESHPQIFLDFPAGVDPLHDDAYAAATVSERRCDEVGRSLECRDSDEARALPVCRPLYCSCRKSTTVEVFRESSDLSRVPIIVLKNRRRIEIRRLPDLLYGGRVCSKGLGLIGEDRERLRHTSGHVAIEPLGKILTLVYDEVHRCDLRPVLIEVREQRLPVELVVVPKAALPPSLSDVASDETVHREDSDVFTVQQSEESPQHSVVGDDHNLSSVFRDPPGPPYGEHRLA